MSKDILRFSSPAEAGVSPRAVAAFLDDVADRGFAVHGFLFLRHGKVFAEGYYAPFRQDEPHRMYSVSKTFVSMAVGALIGEGKLALTDRVASFFPDKCPPDLHPWVAEATVRDLLMMATPFTNQTYTPADPDWVYTFFNTVPSHPAGTVFRYDTSGTYVLDALVERLTGKSFLEYLKEKALLEIGFSPDVRCVEAPEGIAWGGSGVLCSARDLARFALLVANDGVFDGKELLPSAYVREAKASQIDNATSGHRSLIGGRGYGYQIWRTFHNGYAFLGMGGQLALTFPDLDLIAVFIGDSQGHADHYGGIVEALKYRIVDPLDAGEASPDPAGERELLKKTSALSLALPAGKASSPLAESISGRSFRLNRNPMGITSFSLEFGENEGIFRYDTQRGQRSLSFGLGRYILTEFPEKHYSGIRIGSPAGRGYRTASCGVWTEEHKLVLRVYLIDNYFGNLNITLSFKGDEAGLSFEKTAEWFLEEYSGMAGGKAES